LQRSKSWVCSQHPWFFRSSLSQDLCPPCPSARGGRFHTKRIRSVLVFTLIRAGLHTGNLTRRYIRYQHPGKFRDLVFPGKPRRFCDDFLLAVWRHSVHVILHIRDKQTATSDCNMCQHHASEMPTARILFHARGEYGLIAKETGSLTTKKTL
jgi:hypothetical protein